MPLLNGEISCKNFSVQPEYMKGERLERKGGKVKVSFVLYLSSNLWKLMIF